MALLGAFSGHCESLRRFVDSSNNPSVRVVGSCRGGHGGSELREHLHHLGGGVRRVRSHLLPADLPARPPGSHGLQLGL